MIPHVWSQWLAKRAELEAAASEGPWEQLGNAVATVWSGAADWSGPIDDRELVAEAGLEDAEFIADARTSAPAMRKALEAVLELHVPDGEAMCWSCDYGTDFPCPTVTAITTAITTALTEGQHHD